MEPQEYINNYLDNGYHKMHKDHEFIINRATFIEIIRLARQFIQHNTLGDLNIHNGNTTLFQVQIDSNNVYNIHADATIRALREFYTICDEDNDCSFVSTAGAQGGIVLTNKPNQEYIQGFYVYLAR